ncbi:MAG: lycopene cyclase family protein [Myxococcota bacterium]
MERDVIVAGAGPAGLAAAAACAAAGLRVALLAPDPDAPWIPTYASWVDEAGDAPFDGIWPEVEVWLGGDRVHRIARPYGRLDGEALRRSLWERAVDVDVVVGKLADVRDGAALDDAGRRHPAPVVVDATGARGGASAFQTAHGVFARAEGLGTAARWMDFSPVPGEADHPVSFLYALPLPDGRWLLEETVLVGPAVAPELLAARLERRLAAMGVTVTERSGTERCVIPMDLPDRPDPRPGVIRFGAGAGMVHPATGFLVARVLATAPRLAAALVADPTGAGARAALWPGDALRRHRLYRYGARALAGLGAADARAFFDAFFSMPADWVAGWLGDRLPSGALAAGMATLFARLPGRLRWRILAGSDLRELARAALAPRLPSSSRSSHSTDRDPLEAQP